jgi:probable rRNA maturation factor
MKIHFFNETDIPVAHKLITNIEKCFSQTSFAKLHKISQKRITNLTNGECTLIAVSSEKIRILNQKLFKRDEDTDVISLNSSDIEKNIGDIYICPEVISENAVFYNIKFQEELTRVIIHGILHLLGFDHEEHFGGSNEEMFKIQETFVKDAMSKK